MNLKHYFRSFREEELTDGAELYFSGDLDFKIEEKNNKRKNTTGNPSSDDVTLSGEINERDIFQKAFIAKCKVNLNPKYHMISSVSCNCSAFLEDHYGCPHAAALLTAYMAEEQGEEVFRNTRLETLLINRTNVEDPFIPGALKRTDERLLSLLSGEVETSLPVWKKTEVYEKQLKLECTLKSLGARIVVEVKAGPKRLYQIKNLHEFLRACDKEDLFTFGKNEIVLSRRLFDPFSKTVLDFFIELMTASDRSLYGHGLFFNDGNKPEHLLGLAGRELDRFMELYDGALLSLDDSDGVPVSLSRKGLYASLRKKAYGAELKIGDVWYLCISPSWIYLRDNEGIFRVGIENAEKTKALLSLLDWDEPMYIRESDIESVNRRLLPYFRKYGTVNTRGMDLDDYEKEAPSFLFEMDYPKNKVLSCKPYAVYPKADLKCPLYDSETNASVRNARLEEEAAELLPALFETLDPSTFTLYSTLEEDELFDFMKDKLPMLEQLGEVLVTNTLKQKRVRFLPAVSAKVSVESGNLLLSLNATGLSSDEIADILGKYHQKKRYYRLKSGEFLSLEDTQTETWETISELYHSYGKGDPERIKVPAFRALYLQEMLEKKEDASLDQSKEYRDLLSQMSLNSKKKTPVPKNLKNLIRAYQTEGFRWICMLKNCGFGGILADDMGLGKTLQVLAFLLSEKNKGKSGDSMRTLVVCPASLVYNWEKEIETYAPELSVLMVAGMAQMRKSMIEGDEDADIWITSYDLLKRDISFYEEISFANEVIDEAQFVKNQNTQAAQSVRVINSQFRLALTGTPIENHLGELWSIFDYLMPGFLYSRARFSKEYEVPIVSQKDDALLSRLRRMVHPFILRRLKKQVLKDLPDKLEEVISVRLSDEQKKLYDASVEQIRESLNRVEDSDFRSEKLQYLAMLTRLRQICCDPSLTYQDYHGGSAKLDACMELVGQAVEGGHKLLLFSQFTTMLDIICDTLTAKKIAYHRIDGSTGKAKRMQMVDSFANDDVPVFCISLKAGGTGLNLTAADIVIHYDPWWNRAAQDQATDRTHRIGQTQRVTVYEIIAKDTVEERIQKIKDAKTQLVEDVLSGDTIASASINREDMLELLG